MVHYNYKQKERGVVIETALNWNPNWLPDFESDSNGHLNSLSSSESKLSTIQFVGPTCLSLLALLPIFKRFFCHKCPL